jgi:hypothetical protein
MAQPTFSLDGELDLLQVRCRCRADASEGRLDVLALHGRDDVVRCEIEGGQSIRVQPQPQRIVGWTEQDRLADAANACQRVDHVDRGVVVQIQRVVRLLG